MKRKVLTLVAIETEVEVPDSANSSSSLARAVREKVEAMVSNPNDCIFLNIQSCSMDNTLDRGVIGAVYAYNNREDR